MISTNIIPYEGLKQIDKLEAKIKNLEFQLT